MDLRKLNIAIVAGGFSSEKEISLQSAAQIEKWLDSNRYNTYIIKILNDGWYHEHNSKRFNINKNDFTLQINNKHIAFDFVIIAIHGDPGENGKLQSYFDLINIPYSTSPAHIEALTFDKYLSKLYLQPFGIHTAKSILITKNTKKDYSQKEIIKKLGLPLIVKPNASGSSFGVTLVHNSNELPNAINKAFEEDNNSIIIEEYIKGIEVSCGVFYDGNELLTFPPTEIVSETEFFDYEAKYLGKSQEITPARLNNKMLQTIQKESAKIYQAFQCEGIVRVDFIIKENTPYYLEINTVPGMSSESIFPKQAKVKGISMTEIFDKLITQKR